jgi:hypothetical protein
MPASLPERIDVLKRLSQARATYNYCGICGRVPQTKLDEPNYAPLRWWDPDDGWKIGALCSWCAEEAIPRKPEEGDFAYTQTNGVCDETDTDEDPTEALY